jgi:PAS domain-containing protein
MARRTGSAGLWFVLLIAVPLLVLGIGSFLRRAGATHPELGVEWVQSSAGPVAMAVDPDGVAGQAGLQDGDILLEVDAQRVDSALDASQLAWSSSSGESVVVRVKRGASVLTVAIEPRWQPRPEPYTYLAIVGLAFWVSGVFIALRWPAVRGGVNYTFLAFSFFAWLTLSHTGRADPFDWFVSWADLIAGALAPALLIHLGLSLSKRSFRRRREALVVVYSISLISVLFALWLRPEGAGGAYLSAEPLRVVEARESFEPLWLSIAWVLTILLMARSHGRSSSVTHRSQMRWMLWGLIAGLGPFITLYALPWALGAPELPNWARFLAVTPILFVPAACTAALARYRLYDLDMILLRGISEVAAVFGTVAVLSASIFVLRDVLGDIFPLSRSASRYVGFFIAAVSYLKLRLWARIGVEKAFYRQRYSYRATLLDWARELSAETDLSSLLNNLKSRVRETLDVPQAEVLLRTGAWSFEGVVPGSSVESLELDDATLEQLRNDAFVTIQPGSLRPVPWARFLFAMKVKGKLRAILAVADRQPPEEALSSEDRALLGTLVAHAATAIEAARLVLEVRQRASEIERLHARQAKILESSAVGLLLLDTEGRIQAWNRALEEIYGLPRDSAIGRRLSEVFPLHVVRRLEREDVTHGESGEAWSRSTTSPNGSSSRSRYYGRSAWPPWGCWPRGWPTRSTRP